MSENLKQTVLNPWHREHGGHMVEFGGWEMPLSYPTGIVEEHLGTRKTGGLFDISHMGRFAIQGRGAVPYLQYALTNNVLALEPGTAQYTILANETGGAVDDAYLYRLGQEDGSGGPAFLLVVNAANKARDWSWLNGLKSRFGDVDLEDRSDDIAMLALQGSAARKVFERILCDGGASLPDPWRNRLRTCTIEVTEVSLTVSRTGYTGEPLCFELFLPVEEALQVWDFILSSGNGIIPVGLGARDTLRLEATLPLYGHELGNDLAGREIPILSAPSTRTAVSFSTEKGDSIGQEALRNQFEELKARAGGRDLPARDKLFLPRRIVPIAVLGQGIARPGHEVHVGGRLVGHVTSGTMVPYWKFTDEGPLSRPTGERAMRALAMAYVDAELEAGQTVEIRRGATTMQAVIVRSHLSSTEPPFARPILPPRKRVEEWTAAPELAATARALVDKAVANTLWRQRETVNLIPSEQTASPLVRLLTIMDPSHRYAEHRRIKALGENEVFYYQGTKMIGEVERLLSEQLRRYLGCSQVETRTISGQMANTAVFAGIVEYLNRMDRKSEPRRIRKVLAHHISRGGHLSAQPMGALRSYVAVDPSLDRHAALPFPVLRDDPYRIDLARTAELIEEHRPELIILGKSLILYREPVREIAELISGMKPRPLLMYDMAHVLGLVGPQYQQPFREGADIVTGSTHKTFFGTQRGLIASDMAEGTALEQLWDAIVRRVFPGSVSNHHLGTLLGLLMAAYEMDAFAPEYQGAVIRNAKAFAKALHDQGLHVEGDTAVGFTETHQVVVRVGYGRGPEVAKLLEENNIILNYQAAPDDEGFTSASCLRMGVQEMTRFGMSEEDFRRLAELISQIVLRGRSLREEVSRFRARFVELGYCLPRAQADALVKRLFETLA
jgi:aminomethyltransferase